jgi:hypothetical protein
MTRNDASVRTPRKISHQQRRITINICFVYRLEIVFFTNTNSYIESKNVIFVEFLDTQNFFYNHWRHLHLLGIRIKLSKYLVCAQFWC